MDKRKQLISQLLLQIKPGHPQQKLHKGLLTNAANNFNVHPRTFKKYMGAARHAKTSMIRMSKPSIYF
jgi:hypothetical protein